MKGYSPTFSIPPQSEIASKISQVFIELGAIEKCDENCDCEECDKLKDNK